MMSEFESPPESTNNEEEIGFELGVEDISPSAIEVRQVFWDCGIDKKYLTPLISKRLELLNKETKTFKDERQAIEYAIDVFGYWERTGSELKLTDDEKEDVFVGTMFSDIGKTGPSVATLEQSIVITRMYGIDESIDGAVPVSEFLAKFFPTEHRAMTVTFESLDLDPEMPMREFWDLHVFWSTQIIQESDLPIDGKIAAMSHHVLEGNLPEGISSDGSIDVMNIQRDMDQREVLVFLLDKYDARRRRGDVSHEEAVNWLRGLPEWNKNFGKLKSQIKDSYYRCINDLDVALRESGAVDAEELAVAAK